MSITGAAEQPVRPKDFKPFEYPPAHVLREKHSPDIMERAAQVTARADEISRRSGNYRASWESLDRHQCPEWLLDAKFGMFVDWGLYSVPAYAPTGYPDWYLWRMMTDTQEYHNKFWGADFRCDDFIPLFTAKDFDAEHLADVAVAAGMKYMVPVMKHHDGFCLWDSSFTLRNSVEMGPHRDIAREFRDACRKRDLKFGFYYSIDDWLYPIIGRDDQLRIRQWHAIDASDIKIGRYDAGQYERMQISGKIPVRDFFNEYINPAGIEFIDKYDPDLIWGDGDWILDADERNSRTLIAYFYNQAKGRKDVGFNDAYGCTRLIPTASQGPDDIVHGDFCRSEGLYGAGNAAIADKALKEAGIDKPWEECHGLSHSFGYNWRETDKDVRSAQELLRMIIEVVAAGGNMLLITNLTGAGTLDPLLAARLKVVGAWLKVNGEAIYATRSWEHFAEKDVRFTRSKDGRFVYAICLQWPGQRFTSSVLAPEPGTSIVLLGHDTPLRWSCEGGQLSVNIPDGLQDEKNRPCENAWVFRVEANRHS